MQFLQKTKQNKQKQKHKTMSIVRMINDNVVTKHSRQNYLTAVTVTNKWSRSLKNMLIRYITHGRVKQ